jgi:S1-C subfamily serine protease
MLGSSVGELREKIKSDSTGLLKAQWATMILSDADSEHGGSGSPYLNENGEVVGIHSVGMSQYCGNRASLTVSLGIAWPLSQAPQPVDFALLPF